MYPKIAYNISTVYLKNSDYDQSLVYCEKAIAFCKNENNFIYLPYIYYNAACCLSMLKNYDKAKEYLNNCQNIMKLQNHLEEYKKVYHTDYPLYFNKGNFMVL